MAVWSEVKFSDINNSYGRLDSEYYRPEYLESDKILSTFDIYKLKEVSHKIDVGFVGTMKRYYCDNGIPLIQTQQVKEYFLNMNDFIQITPEFHKKLLKSQINRGDLLIARSGSFGKASIYLENEIVNSSDIIIIKIDENKINPFYVLAFLNSKNGSSQLIRFSSGGLQGHVNLTILEDFKIPKIKIEVQNHIASLVLKSYELTKKSQSLYTQAQEILERELGLDKLVFDKPLSYEARLSEVVGNNRADADYYQIPFRSLGNHLKNLKTIPLGKMATIIKGIEVGSDSYVESGIPFLRVSNIKEKGISLGNSDKYISSRLYSALKCYQPQVGELLLTKDGTPGVCYTVTDEIEGIVSGGIVRLQLHDNSFPKEYLSLVVNSRICKMQIDQECSGALIVHWKPNSIRKLKIPVLSDSTMKELGRLVSESKKALTESRQLLEQAKRRVEELIEQAVQK